MLDYNDNIIKNDMEELFSCGIDFNYLRNSSVLVTGAAGMIASYTLLFFIYLNEVKRFNITIYAEVRNKNKLIDIFGLYLEAYYFNVLECEIPELESFHLHVDYIIHAASLASPQYYATKPVETMLPNIIGTNSLLSMAKKKKIKAFVFFSSGSVYGSIERGNAIYEDCVGTFDFLAPGNVYGESKRCGEAICMAYYNEYNVPVRIVRIHHTYGPTIDYKNDKRVFSSFIRNIIEEKNIEMLSDGMAKRAFCYITDMISGMLVIMNRGENGGVYNLANTKEYVSIKSLAQILVGLSPGKQLSVEFKTEEERNYCPSKEKRILPVDCSKVEDIGWKPKVSLEDGLRRTIEYLKAYF